MTTNIGYRDMASNSYSSDGIEMDIALQRHVTKGCKHWVADGDGDGNTEKLP
jgi:hypothetical protein